MRAFKIWNKNRTSSFDLSGLNVITSDIAGLGNRFTNELYDGIIKKHLINQYNSFEQINLTVNFGVNSNAYQKYREFMNFIQANGRNILVIEYYTPGASRFVDVVLSNASKSQKTGFGVLVETVTFDRLTPYYIMYRRTGTSILVSNNYMENVMPKITMSGRTYPAGTKIRVKSKNYGMPDLTGKEYLGDGNYKIYNADGITIDYNVYDGNYTLNGSKIVGVNQYNLVLLKDTTMTLSYFYVSGDITNGAMAFNNKGRYNWITNLFSDYSINKQSTKNDIVVDDILTFWFSNDVIFNNFKFRLQLEKAGNALELDRPIDELNGYTLREVFGNRNMAMPDLTGKEYLADGVYDITSNPLTNNLIYNVFNGIYTFSQFNETQISFLTVDVPYSSDMTISVKMLGNVMPGRFNIRLYNDDTIINSTNNFYFTQENNSVTYTYNDLDFFNRVVIAMPNAYNIFDNQFKLQLEKGTTATPYQVPTNGPYSDIDISTLGLTPEQVTYYGNLYNTLLETPTEYSIPVTDTREIELNELVLSNQELIIDSENKIVTLNGANAYQITNKDKSTFLNLPDGDYLIECDLPFELEYKKWVID